MPDKFKWYRNVRRYRDGNGRFVSETRVATHVDKMAQAYAVALHARTVKLTEDFTATTLTDWVRKTRAEIEALHTAVTIIALGGRKAAIQFAHENAAAWAVAEAGREEQLRYFDLFVFGVVGGVVAANAAMASRAAMYPLAGFATYQNAVRARELAALGIDEEMRILRSDNPCQDCIVEAGKGWVPIGTLRRIGDSVCIVRCRCYFKYRKRPTK